MATEKLETVQDLTRAALRSHRDHLRFTLKGFASWKYEDPAAGAAWYAEVTAARAKYRKQAHEQNDAAEKSGSGRYVSCVDMPGYEKAMREIDKRQPKQYQVFEYYLEATGISSRRYELGSDLGAKVEKIWKRRNKYTLVGMLSLEGILKRLGAAGFEAQLKVARDAEQARIDREVRNNTRANMRDALEAVRTKWGHLVSRGTIEIKEDSSSVMIENVQRSYMIAVPASAATKLPDCLTLEQISGLLSTDEEAKDV